MAVGFEASLGLSSCVGYDETVSQKKSLSGWFFLFFSLFHLYLPSSGCRIESKVDTECTVLLFRMLKQSLGSAGLFDGDLSERFKLGAKI